MLPAVAIALAPIPIRTYLPLHGRGTTAENLGLADPRRGSAMAAENPRPENTGASSGLSLLQPGVGAVDGKGSDR
jgi:hypothetical protein